MARAVDYWWVGRGWCREVGYVAAGGAGRAVRGVVAAVVAAAAGPAVLAWGGGSVGGGVGVGVVGAWLLQAEDVDGVGGRGDAEQRASHVEGHAVDCAGVRSPSELEELLAPRHGEYSDNRSCFAGCGE